jgi:hypothetical protein
VATGANTSVDLAGRIHLQTSEGSPVSRTTDWAIETLNKEKTMGEPEYYIDYKMLDSKQRELADLGFWTLRKFEKEGLLHSLTLQHPELKYVVQPILRDAERLGLILSSSSLVD